MFIILKIYIIYKICHLGLIDLIAGTFRSQSISDISFCICTKEPFGSHWRQSSFDRLLEFKFEIRSSIRMRCEHDRDRAFQLALIIDKKNKNKRETKFVARRAVELLGCSKVLFNAALTHKIKQTRNRNELRKSLNEKYSMTFCFGCI